jgi:hypothetical protein
MSDRSREASLRVRMSAVERLLLERLAEQDGLTTSEFVRLFVQERWQQSDKAAERRRLLVEVVERAGNEAVRKLAARWDGVAVARVARSTRAVRGREYRFDVGRGNATHLDAAAAGRLAKELRPLRDAGFPILLPAEFARRPSSPDAKKRAGHAAGAKAVRDALDE